MRLYSLKGLALFCLAFTANASPICLMTSEAMPTHPISVNGPVRCGTGVVATIRTLGPLTLQDTTVTKAVTVWGAATFDHATLPKVTVHGPLSARYTRFNGPVTVTGNTITLSHSQLGELIVHNDLSSSHPPTVILNHTTVTGSIRFTGRMPGIIRLDQSSVLSKTIINAQKRYVTP